MIEVHSKNIDGGFDITVDGKLISNVRPGLSDWVHVQGWIDQGNVLPDYVPPAVDLASYLADRRWQAEVAGTVWNGWPVATDQTSQQKVLAEFVAVGGGLRTDGAVWKFADGEFRAVSNADFASLAMAVRNHIESCFALEASLLSGISAGTVTTTSEIDAAAWPVA